MDGSNDVPGIGVSGVGTAHPVYRPPIPQQGFASLGIILLIAPDERIPLSLARGPGVGAGHVMPKLPGGQLFVMSSRFLLHVAELSRMPMGNSLGDLGKMLAKTAAREALAYLDRGDVQAAYEEADRAVQRGLGSMERRHLAKVYYAHGKFLTSKGRFDKATADFAKADNYSDHDMTFQLRHRTAKQALKQSFCRGISQNIDPILDVSYIRRSDVVSFCDDMNGKRNVPLSDLPQAAVLHYVREAGYLYPPPVGLREGAHLDEFHALGTYRWQGDEKSSDQFSRWIRRLKAGDEIVSKHLGRLLSDWIWSETDCVKDTDFLVTVPGDPQREAQRGFNPPHMLMEAIRDRLGIPLLLGVLEREESSHARDSTSYQDIQRFFSLGEAAQRIEGRSVVLVDDVATRGYTLRACSEHLRDAGAQRVVCVVLAQSVSTQVEKRKT